MKKHEKKAEKKESFSFETCTSDKKFVDSFYNKSLVNLMRIDRSSFEESEDSYLSSNSSIGYEDMIQMEQMDEKSVISNLKERFEYKQIYTYTGNMLVAINPFQLLNIYGHQHINYYMNNPYSSSPHIFAIAERAYINMKNCFKDQSILICGESGSGKTESTKLILQYLVDRIHSNTNNTSIETKMLESIPILEALGNAKTSNNDNSSRFGKFIKVEFNKQYSISGSKIKAYLLEKSRVTHQPLGERNFHIFYQMTEGGSDEFKEKYFIKNALYYNYLSSTVIELPNINESENFIHFNVALRLFGISEVLIDQLYRILSAILYLGNIEFDNNNPVHINNSTKSLEALQISSQLLGIEEKELEYSLTHNRLKMQKEVIEQPLTHDKAQAITNTLAKCLYHRLFHWLIDLINETTYGGLHTQNYIGILDIFGFENFETNSYEQLLINYANEKFQQLQNHYIFDIEQREYIQEGLNWKKIQNQDNEPILNLIETPPLSILSLLREGVRFPNASPDNFVLKLNKQFSNNLVYEQSQLHSDKEFILHHYAGKVIYTVENWLEKDQDNLPLHLQEIIDSKCTNKLVSIIFEHNNDTSILSNTTISHKFKTQLKELMNTIHLTNPLFIRCIKPNCDKKINYFDNELVLSQLRCTGMLNCIQIRKLGYPERYKHKEFICRYAIIYNHCKLNKNLRKNIKKLVSRIKKDLPKELKQHIFIGKTKILMKPQVCNILNALRNNILQDYVIKLQNWWKMIKIRLYFFSRKLSIITLQRYWKGIYYRKIYINIQLSCICIQNTFRYYIAKKQYIKLLNEKNKKEQKIQVIEDNIKNNNKQEDIINNNIINTKLYNNNNIETNDNKTKSINENIDFCDTSDFSDTIEIKNEPMLLIDNILSLSNTKNNNLDKEQENMLSNELVNLKKKKRRSKRKTINNNESSSLDIIQPKLRSKTSKTKKIRKERILDKSSTDSKIRIKPKRRKSKRNLKSVNNINDCTFANYGKHTALPMTTKELLIGTNWVLNNDIDIDSCCLFYEYNDFVDVIWQFNNISKDRSSQFLGFPHWLPKEQQLDKEQIHINLVKIPNAISTIIICLIIFSPSTSWNIVKESSIRILCAQHETTGLASDWQLWGNINSTTITNNNNNNNEKVNSAKVFCKISRIGFQWNITPINLIVPARTYKALLPYVTNILDKPPPYRLLKVLIHKGDNLLCTSTRKRLLTKYYVRIQFGYENIISPPSTTPSPIWNYNTTIQSNGSFLTISVYQKKSTLLRIDEKLIGNINFALSKKKLLHINETWFNLQHGKILLTIYEKAL